MSAVSYTHLDVYKRQVYNSRPISDYGFSVDMKYKSLTILNSVMDKIYINYEFSISIRTKRRFKEITMFKNAFKLRT